MKGELKILEVIACGEKVSIGADGLITGTITAFSCRFGRIQYEVTWWSGADHKTEWLEECEVIPQTHVTTRIGFKR
jgi:hypothetical protein